MNLILLMLGGVLGTLARYGIYLALQTSSLAWSVFWVNSFGCLLAGIVYGLPYKLPHQSNLLIAIGFLGAFTTFSTFIAENVRLFHANEIKQALLNITLTNVLGFGSFILGTYLIKFWKN